MQIIKNEISVKLIHNHLSFGLKVCPVVACPPLIHIAPQIKLAAFIIKTMGNLVEDNSAHPSIVHSIIDRNVEKRRLHDGSRKDDLIFSEVGIGIHGLRRHVPLQPIDRLSVFRDVPTSFKLISPKDILKVGIPLNLEFRVMPTLVRITELAA